MILSRNPNIGVRGLEATFKNGKSAGTVVATPGAFSSGVDFHPLILRHLSFDWGDMPAEDVESNTKSLEDGGMIMSAYTVNNIVLWIITDPGHAVTTVLLPSEY